MSSEDAKLPQPSDTFCVNPFLEVNITPAGSVRACCAFYPFIAKDGQPMSVYEHSVEEIWDSEAMRSVRRDMIEGKQVKECAYCFDQERKGAASMRTDGVRAWLGGYLNPQNETIEDLKAKAQANDFRLPAGPEWIDLDVGNLCNLKCRMCSSISSSGIANDPVHSRWTYLEYTSVARWQGRAMTIAPVKVNGVEYEGFSILDLSQDAPVTWFTNVASVRVKKMLGEASSVQIKFAAGAAQLSPIEVFANDLSVFRGALADAATVWDIELPKQVLDADELVLRFESPIRVGIEDMKLLRTQTGASKVALSRFSSGKQWFQDEEFLVKDLLYKVGSITKMNFIGGEPFLIKEVRTIMKHLISADVAKNITISMTTNGTIADDEICDLAEQFKYVICAISLDGVGQVNDYIRNPSHWESIEPNIKRLKKIQNAYVYTNMTVQAYNMFHVPAVAQYCAEMDMDFRYHFLEMPNNLSSLVMPVEARKVAAERIRGYALRNAPDENTRVRRTMEIKDTLLGLANILEANTAEPDPKLLEEFMVFTNDLDASRDQDFASINAELRDFIEASGMHWSQGTRFAKYGKAVVARHSMSYTNGHYD